MPPNSRIEHIHYQLMKYHHAVVVVDQSLLAKNVKQALLIFLEIGRDRNVVEPGQNWLVLTHNYTVKTL